MSDVDQLVKMARDLERQINRRRLLIKKLRDLDDRIRQTKKFIKDIAGSSWSIVEPHEPEPDTQVALDVDGGAR